MIFSESLPERLPKEVNSTDERCVNLVLTGRLRDRLKEITDYITLGVDLYKKRISTTKNYISQPHIEFVFLVDLRNGELYWTGKSYPTSAQ